MTSNLPSAILGRTGLSVTRLGYGAAHRRSMTEVHAERVLNTVIDSGVNFIDTANDYGNSEELIGKFISNRRSDFYLATKCGCSSQSGDGPASKKHIWTQENLFRGLEESLQRLKTDYVDVMQMHNPSVLDCNNGNLVDCLEKMREQGKVRWIGVSTTLPDLPEFIKWGVFDVFQIPYSALERDHEEWITSAAESGIGIVLRGGLALGEPGVGTGQEERWNKFEEAGLDDFRSEDESRSAFLLRYTLTHPNTDTIIVGTTNLEHFDENIIAIKRGPLDDNIYREVKQRLDCVGEKPKLVVSHPNT